MLSVLPRHNNQRSEGLLSHQEDAYDDFMNPTLMNFDPTEEVIVIPPPAPLSPRSKRLQQLTVGTAPVNKYPGFGSSNSNGSISSKLSMMAPAWKNKKPNVKGPKTLLKELYQKGKVIAREGQEFQKRCKAHYAGQSMSTAVTMIGKDYKFEDKSFSGKTGSGTQRYSPPQFNRWRPAEGGMASHVA